MLLDIADASQLIALLFAMCIAILLGMGGWRCRPPA